MSRRQHERVLSTIDDKIAGVVGYYNEYRVKNGQVPVETAGRTTSEVLAHLSHSCTFRECGLDKVDDATGLCAKHFDEHLRAIHAAATEASSADESSDSDSGAAPRLAMRCVEPNCAERVYRLAYCERHYSEVRCRYLAIPIAPVRSLPNERPDHTKEAIRTPAGHQRGGVH